MKNNIQPINLQTAIVTGASSGIGQATAIELAKSGANVVVNYLNDKDGATETKLEIEKSGGECLIVQGDVSKLHDVSNLFNATKKAYGNLHILVSNSGIQIDRPFAEMTFEEWNKVIQVNLSGAFITAQHAAKAFMTQGVDGKISKAAGKIVFISSVHDIIPWAGRVNYTSSKGGLKMMMESIAQELAPKKSA